MRIDKINKINEITVEEHVADAKQLHFHVGTQNQNHQIAKILSYFQL
jgi:hypothetical protein